MSHEKIVSYAAYLPRHRVQRAEIGTTLGVQAGKGPRVAASFDEDSTTMGVEAARRALTGGIVTSSIYFATTSPSYLDKTNAAAIHAALGLPSACFAADLAGSARSGIAAFLSAAGAGGLAVLSDIRVGRPGSADEREGADGAAAFVFGEPAVAEILARASVTAEFLDRWRAPHEQASQRWEERFGLDIYLPLITETVEQVLGNEGQPDHVVLVCPNQAVVQRASKLVSGKISTRGCPIGHAGAADAGLGLVAALDCAAPGESILLVSAVDGCDAILLRTTERINDGRSAEPIELQLAGGRDVSYPTYLTWRGMLEREPPRRPEPDAPAGPPSARSRNWKFSFTGSRCKACNFVHLPPARVCKKCGAIEQMESVSMADKRGTVVTYTVDRLAFSPSPPLIDAVIDFDGGGRYTLEMTDTAPNELEVGTRVETTFRRLHTANGIHNYFWKGRTI